MSAFIELQRSRLEENDVVRHQTFKRFRKNPELIPPDIRRADDILSTKTSRPYKETLRQKHELAIFKKRYDSNWESLGAVRQHRKQMVSDAIKKLQDADFKFEYFDAIFEDIRSKSDHPNFYEDVNSVYAMYSSSPLPEAKPTLKGKLRVRKKYIVSEAAYTKFDIEKLFSSNEQYGKYLDLKPFYNEYKQEKGGDMAYLEFLRSLQSGTIEISRPSALTEYLRQFVQKTDPLKDTSELESTFSVQEQSTDKKEPTTENGEIYCEACQKAFKETVYQGHLNGKKHKKNAKNLNNPAEQQPPPNQLSPNSVLKGYLKRLSGKLDDTISYVERHDAMTDREKMIEISELAGDESDYTTANSEPSDGPDDESSDDDDDDLFKNLPLGSDGTPIPFWLFKLQGLNQTYTCEVCGNTGYKGRLTFEKHFSGPKHQQGLRFLGIDDDQMHLFNDITKINEATELWRNIKKQNSWKEGEVENAVEVEDKEGNVLTEKDYHDLKKQGLL